MSTYGKLYLVPAPLDFGCDTATPLQQVMPQGTLEVAAREVVKAEDIIDYTRRENVAERLVKRFGAALGEGAMKAALRSAPAFR